MGRDRDRRILAVVCRSIDPGDGKANAAWVGGSGGSEWVMDDGSEEGTIRLMEAIVMVPGTPCTESKFAAVAASATTFISVDFDTAVESSVETIKSDAADDTPD